MDNWSAEYKQRIVNDLNEAQAAVKETRRSLEARRKLNDELREENTVLRRRNNTLGAEIKAMKRKLADAEALATAVRAAKSWWEEWGDDETYHDELELLRTALRQYREVSDG